jgi:thiol:disulfide interchange protein
MTYDEAIASLLETCENLKEAIEQLQEENAFLADTIEKNNLDQIESERRSLLAENEQYKRNADITIRKANQIKEEYESKISETNDRLADVKKKQIDIDSYIEVESEKKIANIKMEYEKHKKANDKALKQHKDENDKQLQEKETFYKEKNKKYSIITLASIVLAIIGIAINFV